MENRFCLFFLFFFAQQAFANIDIEQWQTSNNVPVYFVENHNLPMVDVSVNIQAGSAQDFENKAGLAALTQALLAKGAADMDENTISEKLADLGAVFNGSVSRTHTELNFRTLKENQNATLSIFLDVLTQPFFLEKVFQRERANLRLELQDALTRPHVVTRRAFTRALYPQHPFGELVSAQTLSNITRDDLLEFHRRFYVASNLKIVIVGDLSIQEAQKMAEKIAFALPFGEKTPEINAPLPKESKENIILIHPATQSHILMGQITIARNHPDYFPLLAGNYILGGGGFSSRLMQEVREKEGLAYSVYSAFSAGAHSGTFEIALQTERSQAQKALKLIHNIVENLIKNGISPADLNTAQAYLSGSFPLNLDSNKKVLRQVVHIAQLDLPLDTLNTWQEQIQALTVEKVNAALKKHLQPHTFLTVQTDAKK